MELIILGLFMVVSFWLGYKMGLRDPLEIKLPEKLKAIVRDDEAQALFEQELAEKRKRERK